MALPQRKETDLLHLFTFLGAISNLHSSDKRDEAPVRTSQTSQTKIYEIIDDYLISYNKSYDEDIQTVCENLMHIFKSHHLRDDSFKNFLITYREEESKASLERFNLFADTYLKLSSIPNKRLKHVISKVYDSTEFSESDFKRYLFSTKPKENRLTIRIQSHKHDLVQRAASLKGYKSLNAFVNEVLVRNAEKIIEEEESIYLNSVDSEIFYTALDNPPKANKKLRKDVEKFKQSSLYAQN